MRGFLKSNNCIKSLNKLHYSFIDQVLRYIFLIALQDDSIVCFFEDAHSFLFTSAQNKDLIDSPHEVQNRIKPSIYKRSKGIDRFILDTSDADLKRHRPAGLAPVAYWYGPFLCRLERSKAKDIEEGLVAREDAVQPVPCSSRAGVLDGVDRVDHFCIYMRNPRDGGVLRCSRACLFYRLVYFGYERHVGHHLGKGAGPVPARRLRECGHPEDRGCFRHYQADPLSLFREQARPSGGASRHVFRPVPGTS